MGALSLSLSCSLTAVEVGNKVDIRLGANGGESHARVVDNPLHDQVDGVAGQCPTARVALVVESRWRWAERSLPRPVASVRGQERWDESVVVEDVHMPTNHVECLGVARDGRLEEPVHGPRRRVVGVLVGGKLRLREGSKISVWLAA